MSDFDHKDNKKKCRLTHYDVIICSLFCFFLSSSLRHPKFVGEELCDALVAFHGHGSCESLAVFGQSDDYCIHCFRHVEHFINAHVYVGGLKPSLKFFIDFVCNEADAGLNAPFGEVKYRPCLRFAFDDPEGPLHAPKFMVMLDDLLRRQVSVGDIAFQSVPSRILCDFVLVYAYMDVILNHQELIVSTLVDVLLVDFPDA